MAIKDKDKFLSLARERFSTLQSAEYHNREASLEDLKFTYNIEDGQWPQEIRDERVADGRPCLTSNKLRKFVSQVANMERDQRLAGKVRPVDSKADVITAGVIEGLIRQIEYASDAETVYCETGEKAIAGGFGYWRLITEEKDDCFDQEVFIRRIKNQFSVSIDPDRKYAFIREGITNKEFEARYPDIDRSSFDSSSIGEEWALWYEKDKTFIAEYFYMEPYDKTIAQCKVLETGQVLIIELTDEITPELLIQEGIRILRQKTSKAEKVKWSKITGSDILEEGDWVGKEIPIIEVEGDSFNIAGKDYKRSLIRDAKDPQRGYNFWKTHMAETVALAPKAPYIVTPQQIKGFESAWNSANKKNLPYLLYNAQGQLIPKRELPPQVPTGAAQMLQIEAGDIQDTIGKYEASFGERSNERTGVAIKQRANRSDFATYHFPDNFRRAIIKTIRQLVDVVPKIYDTERAERIIGEDGKDEIVTINQTVFDDKTGKTKIINDLSYGKYDAVADVRMWSTRRQEEVENLTAFAQGAPNIAPLLLPMIAENSDWPGAQELKKLVDKYLPALMGIEQPAEAGQTTNSPESIPGVTGGA